MTARKNERRRRDEQAATDTGPDSLAGRSSAPSWIGAAWLVGFCLFFYSFALPNSPGFSRAELWQGFVTPSQSLFLPFHLLDAFVDPPSGDGDPPAGWSYFPQRLDLLLVAATILAGAWGVGSVLLRLIRVPLGDRSVEWTVFAFGLGLSALSLVTLGCGLAGWLSRTLLGEFLAASVVGEIFLRLRRRRLRSDDGDAAQNRDAEAEHSERPPIWLIAIVAPFLLAMLLGALLPPTDFDVKEYHLEGPKEFFQQGRISFLEHNVYTSFPFLTEMLSLLAMVLRDDWYRGALAGKAVLMAFAPLTGLAIYSAGRRWFGPTTGSLAALVHLTTPWTYRISIIAYVEGGLSFYLFAALLAVMLAVEQLRSGKTPSPLTLLAGLLAGSAMACKYTGLLQIVLPLGAAIAAAPIALRKTAGKQRPLQTAMRLAAVFGLGALLAVGPWLLKNLVQTGNPVYPLAYSVFGGTDWDPQLDAKWRAGHRPDGYSLKDLGVKLIDVIAKSDWTSPLLFGFAFLAWFAAGNRRLVCWLWMYVLFLFFAWWVFTHRIDRFWVPLIPVVSLLAGVGAAWQTDRVWRSARCIVLALVVSFNLGFIITPLCGYNAYLIDLDRARRDVEQTSPGIAYLNAELPPNARVLCVGEAQVFDARFALVYNTVFDRSIFEEWFAEQTPDVAPAELSLRPVREIRETLTRQGITHVYVNWQEVLRYRITYGYTDFVTPGRFRALQQEGLFGPPEIPLRRDGEPALADVAQLDERTERELRRWGPELIREFAGGEFYVTAEVYPVRR